MKFSCNAMGYCLAAGILAVCVLSSSVFANWFQHRHDGKIEKYAETSISIDEDISDIHFISRPDKEHMIMVTDPKLKGTVAFQCYGMDQIFLHRASGIKERWGERYGEQHLVGFSRYRWDKDQMIWVDLQDMCEKQVFDLTDKLKEAGFDQANTARNGGHRVAILNTNKQDDTHPYMVVSLTDYTDINHIDYKQLVIDAESGRTWADDHMAFQKKYCLPKSEKQTAWEAELKEIQDDTFWCRQGLLWGNDAITDDKLWKLKQMFIKTTSHDGLVLIQIGAAAIDVNDPELKAMFPELASYTFKNTDLIHIFIGDFPSNEEILSIITAR